MKIKKILFLIIALLFIPNIVNAENNIQDDIYMSINDIVYDNIPEPSICISGQRLQEMNINLIWYQSNNGENYTVMDQDDTFDYNTYYKIVFDKTFSQINDSMDEGWECGKIQLEICDKDGIVVDTKTFSSSTNTLEYVYDPIWKYKVTTELEGITYDGPDYVIEGNGFSANLNPKSNYRLPNSDEVTNQFMVIISSGIDSIEGAYEYNSGRISIIPEDIKGDIHIFAKGVETTKIILDANGGKINGNNQYIVEDFNTVDDLPEVIRAGYIFKGWYTKSIGGTYLEKNSQYYNGMTAYAQWDKAGTSTIDFVNRDEGSNLSDRDGKWFTYIIGKGEIIENVDNDKVEVRNKEGKLLFTVEIDSKKIIFADNLTNNDNITYVLTDKEKDELRQKGENDIPDKIEVIVAINQEVKVIFDANEGTFKNDVKTIDIEDIINFNYETFEKPTRKGYKFIGFYTKNGKSYYDVMNSEAGIEEDIFFYAQWQEVSSDGEQENKTPENIITNTDYTTTNKLTVNNPQTGDNIMLFVIILVVSIIGITATPRIRKK